MMKKLSLFLCLLMFTMTTTQAATASGLKQLVDEFNYSLQVEWDQKDKRFYESEVKKFEAGIQKLQQEGLTAKEVMIFIESEVKDQNVVKAIKDSMKFIDINKLDNKASKAILMNNMEKAYKKGANWSGDGVIIGTYVAIVAIVVIAAIVIAAVAPVSSTSGGSSSRSSSGGSYSSGGSSDDSYSGSSGGSGSYDYGYGDSSSGDSSSSDSGSSDSGSSDSGSSDSGSGDSSSGGSDSDSDGWSDDWDWKR